MVRRTALALIACCVVSGATGFAQPTSNHSLADARLLLESCQSEAPTLRAMCLGYLAAMSDRMRLGTGDGVGRATGGDALCPPALVSLDAYRLTYIDYAATRSAGLAELSAVEVAKAAYVRKWKC